MDKKQYEKPLKETQQGRMQEPRVYMLSLQAASILRFRLTEFTCLPIAVLFAQGETHKRKSNKLAQRARR